eukprot:TRINITY_DN8315_c0_g1_i1.p1 TRINITY_DN8315_c0_g1~~TRINITY_DN8315_c0_g1_i1.p1  ORF type:complete len:693 (+),score=120.15 TRINITY_DN8315_c0_g1_i1:218-2296(+)
MSALEVVDAVEKALKQLLQDVKQDLVQCVSTAVTKELLAQIKQAEPTGHKINLLGPPPADGGAHRLSSVSSTARINVPPPGFPSPRDTVVNGNKDPVFNGNEEPVVNGENGQKAWDTMGKAVLLASPRRLTSPPTPPLKDGVNGAEDTGDEGKTVCVVKPAWRQVEHPLAPPSWEPPLLHQHGLDTKEKENIVVEEKASMNPWDRNFKLKRDAEGTSRASVGNDTAVGDAEARRSRRSSLHGIGRPDLGDIRDTVLTMLRGQDIVGPAAGGDGNPPFRRRMQMITLSVVESDIFDQFMGLILMLNAVVLGVQVNWQALDIMFCVLFSLELGMRLFSHGLAFYYNPGWPWSCFDTLIVGMQVMEEALKVINEISNSGAGGGGFEMDVGFLKLLKLGRLLRMVRMIRLIPELKSMVYLILASMSSFFWTCVLLFLLVYMFAVYMTMMATDNLMDSIDGRSSEDRAAMQEYWGSIGDSVMSLFHAISGGQDWADLIHPLVAETQNQIHNVLFVMFIAFSTMVVMNLVTGVFVEGAQRLSREDKDRELSRLAYKTFQVVDGDQSSEITWMELDEAMGTGEMSEFLTSIDLHESDALTLFKLLDEDQSGKISVEEFVKGCLKLKGMARAVDVCTIIVQMKELLDEVGAIHRELDYTNQEVHALREECQGYHRASQIDDMFQLLQLPPLPSRSYHELV